ncbi:NAD-dependent epimerase/dehydratase family protein [Adhaeribacter swui]|uniref:NAD-dependent epimerase/dehydratase family protein n=1 Tax=Adhaeribacter swui TaxID=2086471 RepID=A0A7G7GEL5_9BACT|nr:NAD-dependent epimerase/dehydratase family protein [Adhaeribacter swui]QNF35599.1 NAD-dependent epimerase/dehydratase family protein [Adhaeribacter swui]
MKLSVIITGATGMVGEGVLHECLQHPDVEKVLVINRRPGDITHPKLLEVIHPDFLNFSAIDVNLTAYNACFFCLGVSSVGMTKDEYYRLTYDLTLHVAQTMVRQNPEMVFCYVSGAGTDSTEKGRLHWARVKGKTENDLLRLSFKAAYMFRPGFLSATPGLKNVKSYYKYFAWLAPVLRLFFPGAISSLRELGLAMIQVVQQGYSKPVLEVPDIKALAKV